MTLRLQERSQRKVFVADLRVRRSNPCRMWAHPLRVMTGRGVIAIMSRRVHVERLPASVCEASACIVNPESRPAMCSRYGTADSIARSPDAR